MSAHGDGLLDLRFVVGPDGRTRIAQRKVRFPLRMTVPMYLDPHEREMAFVYAQNPTGGVFAGDCLRTRVALEGDARVHLTTQSATKVYRMDGGRATAATEITLAAGTYFELMPDVLIPQAGSRFFQTTEIEIASGAACLVTELVAPGRLARGERFAYSTLDLRTNVVHEGRSVVSETLLLEPQLRPPGRRGLMGGHLFAGTALALAPSSDTAGLLGTVDAACARSSSLAAIAGCALPGDVGVAVRALADSHRALRGAIDTVWAAVREHLLGAPPPPRRK